MTVTPDYSQIASLYKKYLTIFEINSASSSKTVSVQLSLIDQIYFYSPKVVSELTFSSIKVYANDRDQHVFDSLKGLRFNLTFEFTNRSYFFNEKFSNYIQIDNNDYVSDLNNLNTIIIRDEFLKFKSLKFCKFNMIMQYANLS